MREKDWITLYLSHALRMQVFRKNKEEKRLKNSNTSLGVMNYVTMNAVKTGLV